jgi:hypothetical protein
MNFLRDLCLTTASVIADFMGPEDSLQKQLTFKTNYPNLLQAIQLYLKKKQKKTDV